MSNYKKAVLALIITSIIWGAGSPIFKWSLQGISPLMLAFFRFVLSTIIFALFFKKIQKVRIRDGLYFALLGVLNCALNIGLYFMGLQYAPSINQPVIASAGPIFIIVGSAIFLGDRATKKVLFGNLVGLTGVLFIVLEPVLQTHQSHPTLGNILFVLATIIAALGTLVSRKLASHYNAYTLGFWTFFIATISFLPIPIEELSTHTIQSYVNIHSIVGVLYGAIFSSAIAYFLFYWALRYIKASETTIFTYIDPVAAIFIAVPLLKEYPNPPFILGSILVFLGIYIAEGRLHWHPIHKLFK